MFFKLKAYIQFLFKSTNQHGVHSPFVYDLVTKCFYDKKKKDSSDVIKSIFRKHRTSHPFTFKIAKLIYRLPSYLGYKNILVLEEINVVTSVLSIDTSVMVITDQKQKKVYDMIYVDLNCQGKKQIEALFSKTHNHSLVVLGNIHQSKNNQILWEYIKSDASVRVAIDTFSLGFVFFRKEQAKEHFVIRV